MAWLLPHTIKATSKSIWGSTFNRKTQFKAKDGGSHPEVLRSKPIVKMVGFEQIRNLEKMENYRVVANYRNKRKPI